MNTRQIIEGRKSLLVRLWMIILCAMMIISMSGCGSSKKNNTPKQQEQPVQEEESTQPDTTEDEFEAITKTVGDIEYTINSVKITDTLGGQSFNITASDGVYLVISVSIKNNSTHQLITNRKCFELLNGDMVFEHDEDVVKYINHDERINSSPVSIEVNDTLTGTIVFSVSEKVANSPDTRLQLWTAGTDPVTINLR